jgi:anti-anti-sigma regulatory factor
MRLTQKINLIVELDTTNRVEWKTKLAEKCDKLGIQYIQNLVWEEEDIIIIN